MVALLPVACCVCDEEEVPHCSRLSCDTCDAVVCADCLGNLLATPDGYLNEKYAYGTPAIRCPSTDRGLGVIDIVGRGVGVGVGGFGCGGGEHSMGEKLPEGVIRCVAPFPDAMAMYTGRCQSRRVKRKVSTGKVCVQDGMFDDVRAFTVALMAEVPQELPADMPQTPRVRREPSAEALEAMYAQMLLASL